MRWHCITMVIVALGLQEVICRTFMREEAHRNCTYEGQKKATTGSQKTSDREESGNKLSEGPFEALVQNVSNCVVEQPWFHANVTTYTSNGHQLLRGKIVTQRSMKNIKFNIQVYYIEQGKFKVWNMKNQNCHNIAVRVVLQALKLRHNAQKCTMEPTSTEFTNLDLNAILHTMIQSLWYGAVEIRWEIATATPAARIMCLDINLNFIKADKSGVKTG